MQLWKFWLEERDQHTQAYTPSSSTTNTGFIFWSLRAQKLGEFLYLEGSVEIFEGLRPYAAISCQV